MTTVVKRQIRATPQRSADETWNVIVDLLAPDKKSSARTDFERVAGIIGQVIASEATKDSPVVVFGNGPRVRLYCLYDDDAMAGDDANENSLAFTAAEGDWRMSVPCLKEDLEWVQKQLKARSSRIVAREVGDDVEDSGTTGAQASAPVEVDVKAFLES
jgi:hypothetical protein